MTQLLHPPTPKMFETSLEMIDMVGSRQYTMITTDDNDWYFAESKVSNEEYYVRLRNALRLNPLRVSTSSILYICKNGLRMFYE